MSGGQAETLLQAKGEPWTFLVRESLSQPGDFVLSVLSDQPKAGPGSPLRVTHIKVMCEVRPLSSREGILPGLLSMPNEGAVGGSAWALVQGWGSREGDRDMWNGLTSHPSGRTLHRGWFRDLRQPHRPGGAFQEDRDRGGLRCLRLPAAGEGVGLAASFLILSESPDPGASVLSSH